MHLISIEYQNMKQSFMNISHSVNKFTRIDETDWLKAVLVLDNWVKLWEAHLCFDLYVDLSFIAECEVFLDRILIWITDPGILLVLDRCRECEIASTFFRVILSWMMLMKLG